MQQWVFAIAFVATTLPAGAVETKGPVGGKPYEEQVTVGNERFLLDLKARIEQSGYDAVQVVPRMFFVTARDKQGHAVCLVVDSNSLQTLRLQIEGQSGDSACPMPSQ